MRGEVDVVTHSSPEDQKSIQTNQVFEIVSSYGQGYSALWLNCRPTSLLADRAVRRALNYAINRRAIWQYMGGDSTTADMLAFPTGPFAPESPYNDPQVMIPEWNPQLANRLLDEAGWKDSDGDGWREKEGRPLELYLLMPTEFAFFQKVAGQLRKDLGEIGIRLYVRQEPFTRLASLAFLTEQRFDLLWGGGGYNLDTDICTSWWYSSSPGNYSGYASAEVDRLIEKARSTYELPQRILLYRDLHRQLMEDQPVIFVCRFPMNFAMRGGIKGTELTARLGLFRVLPQWYWDKHP